MAQADDKLGILAGIQNEPVFLRDVVVPLFRRIGFKRVNLTHGADEDGKDVVCFYQDRIGRERCVAVVAKHGKVRGGSGYNSVSTIIDQVGTAFRVQYPDPASAEEVPVSEVYVVVSGTFTNAARRQVMGAFTERVVNVIDGTELVDLIDKHWDVFWEQQDPALTEFYRVQREHHEHLLQLRTLGYASDRRLRDLFVDLKLEEVVARPPRLGGQRRKKGGKSIVKKAPTIRSSQIAKRPGKYVIVGEAGAGKSSALQNLVLAQIEENIARGGPGAIPVLIQSRNVGDSVFSAIERSIDQFRENELPFDLRELLEKGEVLVLIDGFDEIADDVERAKLAERIHEFTDDYPKCSIVLSTRPVDQFDMRQELPRFKQYAIRPFGQGDTRELIGHWFAANETLRDELRQVLEQTGLMSRMPQTPMAVTMIAIVFERSAGELPANISDLFQKYTELFLGKWDQEEHGLTAPVEFNIGERILSELATEMGDRLDMPINEASGIAQRYLGTRGISADSRAVVEAILRRSGFFSYVGEGVVGFRHRSFQAFFIALRVHRSGEGRDALVRRFLDRSWAEAAIFFAGLEKECPDFLEDLLATEPSNPDQLLLKTASMGWAIQGAYLTERGLKAQVMRTCISEAFGLLREFSQLQHDHPDSPFGRIPKFVFLMVCIDLIFRNYNSRLLEDAITEAVASFDWRADPSEKTLFAAYVSRKLLAAIGNRAAFIEIAASIPESEVHLQVAAEFDLEYGVPKSSERTEALKSIRRKLRSAHELVRREIEQPLRRLVPPDDE